MYIRLGGGLFLILRASAILSRLVIHISRLYHTLPHGPGWGPIFHRGAPLCHPSQPEMRLYDHCTTILSKSARYMFFIHKKHLDRN